jgi:branched-chain amino acid transport system ATP-binding protein
MSKDHDVVLQVESVTKKYGGLVALDNVSVDIGKGEILGLIGPNGAGKTTLFNTICGSVSINSGKITFNGQDITREKPFERCNQGIARTFQITKPFMNISVLDNVMIGAYFGKKPIAIGGGAGKNLLAFWILWG